MFCEAIDNFLNFNGKRNFSQEDACGIYQNICFHEDKSSIGCLIDSILDTFRSLELEYNNIKLIADYLDATGEKT